MKEEEIKAPHENSIKPSIVDEDLDAKFREFEKTTSEFVPDSDDVVTPVSGEPQKDIKPTMEQTIKIKMVLGFACMLLSGLNTFLLNKIKKTKVPFDKMILSDEEQATLEPYLNSADVLNMIDKIPTWLLGILHIEYLFYTKHSIHSDEFKIIKEEKND